jgi:MerR family transcriptional regulator/heat shock protein HspR
VVDDMDALSSTKARPDDRAVYVISVAAELAGVHPQTLRIYERRGLVSPARTPGNSRRYSDADIARLRMIQRLTQELGVNLAGVQLIMDMEVEVDRLRQMSERLAAELDRARQRLDREAERLERLERRDRPRTEIVPMRSVGPRLVWRAPAAGGDGAVERTIT